MNNLNTDTLLKQLTHAVAFVYPNDINDIPRPGIVISYVKNNSYYASVVRYDKNLPVYKQVICNTYAPSIFEALQILSQKFVDVAKAEAVSNPLDELINLLK